MVENSNSVKGSNRASHPQDESGGGRVVALVEWNEAGHHQTFFRYFSAALLGQGVTVLPLCPWDGDEISSLVEASLPDSTQTDMGGFLTPVPCHFPRSGGGRLSRFRKPLEQRRHFKRIAARISDWEKRSGRKIDLLFFCCIYDHQFETFPGAASFLCWPWSGLYLDSRHARLPGTLRPYSQTLPRPREIFSAKGLHSLAILDEGIIEETQKFCQGRPVYWFPDIADIRKTEDFNVPNSIGAKIRSFAAGRKIVGCLGHLQKTKGLLELVRAAKDPRLAEVLFVFVGEANLFGLADEVKEEIIEAWEQLPNIFCHPLRVAEPTYNSAFEACDVIAAPYKDFPNSSNTLTKAAAFSKPIVVNDGHLMAERVGKFNLGTVVTEGDHDELVSALLSLTYDKTVFIESNPKWKEYFDEHSQEKLSDSFNRMISSV